MKRQRCEAPPSLQAQVFGNRDLMYRILRSAGPLLSDRRDVARAWSAFLNDGVGHTPETQASNAALVDVFVELVSVSMITQRAAQRLEEAGMLHMVYVDGYDMPCDTSMIRFSPPGLHDAPRCWDVATETGVRVGFSVDAREGVHASLRPQVDVQCIEIYRLPDWHRAYVSGLADSYMLKMKWGMLLPQEFGLFCHLSVQIEQVRGCRPPSAEGADAWVPMQLTIGTEASNQHGRKVWMGRREFAFEYHGPNRRLVWHAHPDDDSELIALPPPEELEASRAIVQKSLCIEFRDGAQVCTRMGDDTYRFMLGWDRDVLEGFLMGQAQA